MLPRRVPADAVAAISTGWPRRTAPGWPRGPEEQLGLALPVGWPRRRGTPTSCTAGWTPTAPTRGTTSTRSCGGAWCTGWPSSAALDAEAIEAERRRDGTVEGDLGAATALAARPTAEAKAEAWAGMTEDPEVSNRRFLALASGLWSPEQAGLVAPYVPALRRGRAAAGAARVGVRGRGRVGASRRCTSTTPSSTWCVTALRGDVPPVLRRAWEDALDDRA